MPVKGRKGKASAKALLLASAEEDEVDEPIAAPVEDAPAVLVQPNANEEEHDEPLLPNGTDNTAEKMEVEDKTQPEQPVLDLRNAQDAGAVTDLQNCSAEFAEAVSAIATDSWDISSWIIYFEEVEQGRGGDVTLVEAYERIIAQFPRSARFWKNLADYHLKKGDVDQAEATYRKCLHKCRSIDLWMSYLNYQMTTFNDALRMGLQTEQYLAAQAKCEGCFKEAVDNVGLALHAYPIWRGYLDFVKNWPELGMLESGKKLRTLRELYQRAVAVAMEQAEELWNEYEAFERAHGDPATVEMLLPEVNRKFLHAKSIMRERKRFMGSIVFDRLATPPTAAPGELQQLEQWAHWIGFELSGPDYLNPESFVPMLRMVFEQCLCCFRYNAEVWLAYALFERDEVPKRLPVPPETSTTLPQGEAPAVSAGRNVYLEAIDAVPTATMLRAALAELEEVAGNMDAAKEVLRVTFEQNPSGATFSMFQRFIRRTLGIAAARRMFSETNAMRASNPKIALELYLAHAKLELEVNCAPQVALGVLNLAQKACPDCFKDAFFVQAITRVLTLLGDLKQIRWVFQTALAEFAGEKGALALHRAAAASAAQERPGRRFGRNQQVQPVAVGNYIQLKTELLLWEEYLHAETVLGLSDVARLDELRIRRDKVKALFDEAERVKMGVVYATKDEARAAQQRGLFHPAQDLCERYDAAGALPSADRTMQERCAQAIAAATFGARAGAEGRVGGHAGSGGRDQGDRHRRGGIDHQAASMSTEFHLSLAGLPVILRDLLGRLPFHSGPLPDVDGFIRHMKGVILPPRPEPDANDGNELDTVLLRNADGTADGDGLNGAPAPSWLGKHATDEDEQDTADGVTDLASSAAADEDVFRKRKRARRVL